LKKILKYKELKRFITKVLNFEFTRSSGTSHEIYKGFFRDKIRVVTLDNNHDKFNPKTQMNNISSMAKQMGFKNNKDFFRYYETNK